MSRSAALVMVACCLPSAAEADPESGKYIPLGLGLPQIGLGAVTRGDNDMELEKYDFDATLRFSPSKVIVPRLRVGGFVEVRSAAWDTFEFGLGPHVMGSLSELWAVQLRTGVATVSDGPSYALVGIQIGNPVIGLTATGRRFFDDDHYELSVNVELTSALLLVPFLLGGSGFATR